MSMQQFTAQCALQSLMLMVASLKRLSVEFAIIAFGESVRIIKTTQQEWSPMHAWMILTQLRFEDFASLDADAIHCALDLLSAVRGPKTVFVLSDGFGTSGLRMSAALYRANEENVKVIGCGIGLDRFNTSSSYQHWMECALPKHLPTALRALFEYEDSGNISNTKAWQGMDIRPARLRKDGQGYETEKTILEILTAHKSDYDVNIIAELNQEREDEMRMQQGRTNPDDLAVDVCFALDATGSMAPYFAVAKSQIKSIVVGIQPAAEKQFPGIKIKLRVAIVCYGDDVGSDYSNSTLKFTESVEEVKQFLDSQRATGGDDIAEDVNGCFQAALALEWKSSSKTIVLITDAPGHGRDCCDPHLSDDAPDTSGPDLYVKEMIARDIGLFFCKIDARTDKMEERLMVLYNDLDEDRLMENVSLIDTTISSAPPPLVFILCLDESGSMSGSPFEQLREAYRVFINRRNSDQGSDRIVVINFASSARYLTGPDPVEMRSAPGLDCYRGGTMFGPALDLASQAMSRPLCANAQCVMLFMTDGQSGDGNVAVKKIEEMSKSYPRLICHTVGFGTGPNVTLLQQMVCGGGEYHAALTGADLVKSFGSIAAMSGSANQLSTEMASKIMDTAVNKLIVDFL
eukprot:gene4735-6642_t